MVGQNELKGIAHTNAQKAAGDDRSEMTLCS